MGKLFFWMWDRPADAARITATRWNEFLDFCGMFSAGTIVVATIVIFLLYARSAKGLKLHTHEPLFARYSPLTWLWLAPLSALFAAAGCAWGYHDLVPADSDGVLVTTFEVFLATAVCATAAGYLIVLIPGITPGKFKYRPRAWMYRGRGTPNPQLPDDRRVV
jgi:hypothetical protein